jgi:hypothetical protein
MNTCTTCVIKHLSDAWKFRVEANAGYSFHISLAYGEMDHAEMECQELWPEISEYIHEQKKHIADAVEQGIVSLANKADIFGLIALVWTVEGKEHMLRGNSSNSKVYDFSKWIHIGRMIRYEHGLPLPQEFYDQIFAQAETVQAINSILDEEASTPEELQHLHAHGDKNDNSIVDATHQTEYETETETETEIWNQHEYLERRASGKPTLPSPDTAQQ